MQVIFKMCIDLVYQMNNNEYTLKLTKDLTREQRFLYLIKLTINLLRIYQIILKLLIHWIIIMIMLILEFQR